MSRPGNHHARGFDAGARERHLERDEEIVRRNFIALRSKPDVVGKMTHYFLRGSECWNYGLYDPAVVMFRVCWEAMLRGLLDVENEKISLVRLVEMAEKMGRLDSRMREAFRTIRDFGNTGAHAGARAVTYDEAWEALRISCMYMNAMAHPSPFTYAAMGTGHVIGDQITELTMPRRRGPRAGL